MTTPMPPLAFVYDRCASRSRRQLHMRLDGCRHYAEGMGWAVADCWVDLGDHALAVHRPQLAALLTAMRAEADHHEVLCLVHTRDRLATDATHLLLLQQRVTAAGGRTVTTFGESDQPTLSTVLDRKGP
ncbi:recombinase family protein [Streptomyces sp. ISID311]|uniref:recombinase family protein n=1 Tax=Streptomyces sp. ISID311 TaxID=2601673 RepID=UPI0011BD437E|nr:recombinase family protein [Streptomyces sp. ISID311]TXC95249.1 recombinase family protein [Streptomyces sp. ISID311]